MDYLKIIELVLVPVFFVVTLYFGVQYGKGKEKLAQVAELFNLLVLAIDDDKISEQEMRDVIAQVKKLLGLG